MKNIKVKGKCVQYTDVEISPIDSIIEIIKSVTKCENYNEIGYYYCIENNKLVEMYDNSYYDFSEWKVNKIISEDENIIELYKILENSIKILNKLNR